MDQQQVYILSGGQSRRFGSDKGRATIQGKPSLVWQADYWKSHGREVFVVTSHLDVYEDLNLPTVADPVPFEGPLSGIATALTHFEKRNAGNRCWISSCDLLAIPEPLIGNLCMASQNESSWVTVMETEQIQPFPGIYDLAILPIVENLLAHGERSLRSLWEKLGSRLTRYAATNQDRIVQFNTPEEWSSGSPLQ